MEPSLEVDRLIPIMELGVLFFVMMVSYVLLAAIAGGIAQSKGQNFYTYFFSGLLFTPMAVLLAALLTESRRGSLSRM